jgi:hypothetical protein
MLATINYRNDEFICVFYPSRASECTPFSTRPEHPIVPPFSTRPEHPSVSPFSTRPEHPSVFPFFSRVRVAQYNFRYRILRAIVCRFVFYHLAIVFPVLLRIMASDYPFGVRLKNNVRFVATNSCL